MAFSTAAASGVHPALLARAIAAPWLSSNSTTPTHPFAAAHMSGVLSLQSTESKSTPFSTRHLAAAVLVAALLHLFAKVSGVSGVDDG
ncbi:hypothetical protein PF010_g30661 [Phytophthora fragariae]|uniref:Uncharacterized protein n=1 Tax=Phytophthora fragariae TaxID=53985 RepID=A0A6A3PXT0_9STRA|nr:hypothetical protein PF003_g17492 [Phytophthora fragariae]KAE8941659.1 hypothetical protein PF009_g8569 [Phytophthora fragariae]KAE8960132.1 hypothetical protein PF011_g30196 [Phytophthora fragariae]KAE9059319.1 hypothetical protein PF010_g30661 [Phytophthora fragariae]KAE9060515.1 hypothetical protein PF007_g30579 [Phytophthora fragariae]